MSPLDFTTNVIRSEERKSVRKLSKESKPFYPKWVKQGKTREECESCAICLDYFDGDEYEFILQHQKQENHQEEAQRQTQSVISCQVKYEDFTQEQQEVVHKLQEDDKDTEMQVEDTSEVNQTEIEGILKEDSGALDTSGVCVLTACNHGFHKKCIKGWLKTKNICPSCRKEVFFREEEHDYDEEAIIGEYIDFVEDLEYFDNQYESDNELDYYLFHYQDFIEPDQDYSP
ncbi:unnamed protein product [Moneuplotes crassus]|uniref:RING-type domain-containing protein n=1 Tax=Euplotes crassus TaxID=5936 RepID=A0AAD1XFS4_EUPCR|nr:unnamed protein product [Moneuplotes crassus]